MRQNANATRPQSQCARAAIYAGFKSPLAHPEGIDFVIVRENMEKLYYRVESRLGHLAPLHLYSGTLERELDFTRAVIGAL
jgi:isocitrate/isopropylmalate dehydrogenase